MIATVKIFLLYFVFAVFSVFAAPSLSPASIDAKAYVLFEAESQSVLAQYRATERLSPASITKLMTAFVVYEEIKKGELKLDDVTKISRKARNMTEGSRMFLEKGSWVTIDDLLHGLVIQSGNDAAIALAEAVSGTEGDFVDLMNQYAAKLGLTNSLFKNVTGLTEVGHYMSAMDIARLARAIITEFPEHYSLYKAKSFTWNNITQANRNALLVTDKTVDGLKTGYTDDAGYCLTSSAKRGDMRLISVVLGTKSAKARVAASKKLLGYGFEYFELKTLYQANQQIAKSGLDNGKQATVPIAIAERVRLPVAKSGKHDISAQLVLDGRLVAPIRQHQTVGKVVIKRDNKAISSIPAVTLSAVEEAGFFSRTLRRGAQTVESWFSP